MNTIEDVGIDPGFGISDFDDFKVYSESDTIINNFLMLLFMRPGALPSLPNIGMEIGQYLYMFFDDIDVESIKIELISQCEAFLPYVQTNDFNIIKTMYKDRPTLLISLPVKIDENLVEGATIALSTNINNDIIFKYALDNELKN